MVLQDLKEGITNKTLLVKGFLKKFLGKCGGGVEKGNSLFGVIALGIQLSIIHCFNCPRYLTSFIGKTNVLSIFGK